MKREQRARPRWTVQAMTAYQRLISSEGSRPNATARANANFFSLKKARLPPPFLLLLRALWNSERKEEKRKHTKYY